MYSQLLPSILRSKQRRASVNVVVAVSLTLVAGFAALAVDIAYVCTARAEMQSAADAAALAGTTKLLNELKFRSQSDLSAVIAAARSAATGYVQANPVYDDILDVDANADNGGGGGIVIGFLADATDRDTPLDLSSPSIFNSVQVTLRCDNSDNPSFALGFARLLGHPEADVSVRSTGVALDGIVGYKHNSSGVNPQVLPLALHQDVWYNLVAQIPTDGSDSWAYDPDSGVVSAGSDSFPEVNLYPGSGTGQLPPGNFGTVDIGSNNNSTADISRQILHGISEEDLAYLGGQLQLGPDGTLPLNGDTGLSAAIKDELTAIIGQPRSIPIFSSVSGPGNNAQYIVTGFVGIRILDVRLTGAMRNKRVIIQPAVAVDPTAIPGGCNNSYYVYRPPVLCR